MNTNPCEHCGGTKDNPLRIGEPSQASYICVDWFHGSGKSPIQQEKPTAEEIAKVQKLLMDAPVPTEGRHFINTMTGEIDDPTGIDFGVFGDPTRPHTEALPNADGLGVVPSTDAIFEPNQELELDFILADQQETLNKVLLKRRIQKLLAHEKQEAVKNYWKGKAIPYETIGGEEYVKLSWLRAELESTEGEGK